MRALILRSRPVFFASALAAVLAGSTASAQTTFTNASTIVIPTVGPAMPYPSTIAVSGLTGTISKVTVQLNGFAHGFPDDVDVLLVGPTGADLLILSDVGGSIAVSGVNLNLDDAAGSLMPDGGTLATGTYRPTAVASGAADMFPAPGPGLPSHSAAPTGASTLASVFNGTDPNGTWKLYVVDDLLGDTGGLAGGWSLTITTSAAASTTTAVTSSANPSATGSAVTFTATVTSSGSPVTTGTVTFREGGAVLQAATAVDASGHVAFTTSSLAEGTHAITAHYDGDAGHAESSATLSQVVDNPTNANGNTFCNDASGITVNDGTTGSPYASHIVVTGLAGTISK